ncbi:Aste57867_10975 [Aphanomyces stellatus]|uniref:Aste57867_10975 protein n=1 Tax=Aphanomyces stellatus TaxID=120398 RepID=A0A485KRP8_9STRA|nr:hypothetical protein As57867_010934 [Aphanomyces stellatus]VFT87843.1 Aste57867_10975 [Aphanomyces stellatus]
MAKTLEANYPHLAGHIDGINYVTEGWKGQAAAVLSMLRWVGFAFLLFGEYVCMQLGIPYSEALFEHVRENNFILMMVMMAIGVVAQNLGTSGAFEVYFNGERIFSKLEASRVPTTEEVIMLCKAKGLKKHDHAK